MTNMQECFWEVALTKSRDEFLKGKQAAKFGRVYAKTNKPIRLNRDHKSSIFAAAPTTSRVVSRLDRLAGRA